jgi:hypothetical protein
VIYACVVEDHVVASLFQTTTKAIKGDHVKIIAQSEESPELYVIQSVTRSKYRGTMPIAKLVILNETEGELMVSFFFVNGHDLVF